MAPQEESLQERNRRLGRAFERDVYNKVKGSCTFAANFGGNATSLSTPDIMCLQGKGGRTKPNLRMMEAKRNGYIPPDQRDELVEIAKEDPGFVQLEAWYRPSPRKKKKRIIHRPGQDPEKTRRILEEEFSSKKLEE